MLALLGLAAGCGSGPGPGSIDIARQEPPSQEAREVWFELSERGHVRLQLWTGVLQLYRRPDSTVALLRQGVRARLFDPEGTFRGELVARAGTYWPEKRRVLFQDGVELKVGDRHLWSTSLELDARTERLFSPGFVRIQTPEEWIEGYGLEAAFDLSWYRLRRITGRVVVPDMDA